MDAHNSDGDAGQVSTDAAHVYDKFFVPALFGQWPARVLDLVGASARETIADIGCGTGSGARVAAQRVGNDGRVIGIDPNPGMLAVARSSASNIDWRAGTAESIPLPDASVDRTISLFAAMFFADLRQAIAEMQRITRPGGSVALAVWGAIETSPGYVGMLRLLTDVLGERTAAALRAPFSLGNRETFAAALGPLTDVRSLTEEHGMAQFSSLAAWLQTEIRGWTLADSVSDRDFERLRTAAPSYLGEFVAADGTVSFAVPALVAVIDR